MNVLVLVTQVLVKLGIVLANQAMLAANQRTILANQSGILANQATQERLLTHIDSVLADMEAIEKQVEDAVIAPRLLITLGTPVPQPHKE